LEALEIAFTPVRSGARDVLYAGRKAFLRSSNIFGLLFYNKEDFSQQWKESAIVIIYGKDMETHRIL
jgi:hypothetical protein